MPLIYFFHHRDSSRELHQDVFPELTPMFWDINPSYANRNDVLSKDTASCKVVYHNHRIHDMTLGRILKPGKMKTP